MRRVLVLAVLALALPLMAYADSSIDLSNRGGTITGNAAGLSLTGSTLKSYGVRGRLESRHRHLHDRSLHLAAMRRWRHTGARRLIHDYGQRDQWGSEWRDFQWHLHRRRFVDADNVGERNA